MEAGICGEDEEDRGWVGDVATAKWDVINGLIVTDSKGNKWRLRITAEKQE